MLQNWTPRIITFLLWALAAGSAAFWILQGVNAAPAEVEAKGAHTRPGSGLPVLPSLAELTPQVALALGAKNPVSPTAASELAASQARFQLMGVLAASSGRSVALIAVDGKPAKTYRVGASLDEGLQVLAVAKRSVSIGDREVAFELQLPTTITSASAMPSMPLVTAPSVNSKLAPPAVTDIPTGPSQANAMGEKSKIQKLETYRPSGADVRNKPSANTQLIDDDKD